MPGRTISCFASPFGRRGARQPQEMTGNAITVDEFCEMIGIGRSTFYKAVAAGHLQVRKYGKRTFITQEEMKRRRRGTARRGWENTTTFVPVLGAYSCP